MSDFFDMNKFDKIFKDNRKLYYDEPIKAHKKQVEHVKTLDEYTGGKSRYDEASGIWYLSDGRQSNEMDNGIIGNSYYNETFNRKNTPSYKKYKDSLNKYSENDFSYDVKDDPLYKTYKKQYTENGRKVMEDTIAKVASNTGGIAGSYAVSAGATAMNDYMKGLDEVISELEERAYDRYMDKKEQYLKEMSIAESQMAEDEKAWKYNNEVIKAKEKEEREQAEKEKADAEKAAKEQEEVAKAEAEKENKYAVAMRKFQSEGFDAMTDSDWKAIYAGGGWFNPDEGLVYDANGNSFLPYVDDGGYKAVLVKFQEKGWSALSDDEKKTALDNGWYDTSTGYLYDSAGNAYASAYSDTERALAKYKTAGLANLTEEELLILENAGYKVRDGILLNAYGYAV